MNSRFKQTTLDVGRCRHDRREGVYAEAGVQIAIRCKDCTAILGHVGQCDGCGKRDAELFALVATKRKRFCDAGCYEKWQAARRQERAEAEAKLTAKPLGGGR